MQPQPPGTVTGEIQARQKFRIKSGKFEGEYLTIETVALKGVSYRFEGQVSNYRPNDQQVITPQFKGTLTKLVKGKQTASAKVTLVHVEPEF